MDKAGTRCRSGHDHEIKGGRGKYRTNIDSCCYAMLKLMTLLGETRTCKRSSDRERRTRGQRSRRIHQQVCTDSDERDDRLPETASFSSLNPVTSNMQTSSKVFLLGTVGYSLLESLSDTAGIQRLSE